MVKVMSCLMTKPPLTLSLRYLTLFACFFALGVIALGAFTRLIDAGLGCPDWPGCYGHFIPTILNQDASSHFIIYKAWAEMIHRYFAGCLGILIIVIFILLFKKEIRNRTNIFLAISLFLLLSYQVMLGQWTVTLKLLPIIVTQHLLGGYLILSILWLVYLSNKNNNLVISSASSPWVLRLGYIGLLLLLLQILLGAWTSTNYASLSCPDFPFCHNNQVTRMYFREGFNVYSPLGLNYEGGVLSDAIRQTIHMTHRLGALILTLYLFIYASYAMLTLKRFPVLMQLLYIVFGLLLVQWCLGLTNVIFKLPLLTAISHTIVASLLLLALITFIFKLKTIQTVLRP